MPTRAGLGVLVAGIVLIAAGRVLGPVEFMVAGVAAVTATTIAVLVRRLLPSRIAIGRIVTPARLPAGQPARVDLEIINRNRRRSPQLRLHDSVSGTRGVRLSLAPIDGGGTATGAYRLPTTRRGIIDLGPIRVDDVDALGLARRRHRIDTSVRLIVHPPVEAVPPVRVPAGDDPLLGDELRQSLGLSDEEFDGLREYAPGDDLRKVHWPSSARHDELLVRQFRPPRHGRLGIVVDTRPPGSATEVLDITTSVAASIAAAVLDAGDATRIETTDGRATPLASAPSQLDGLLEFLALLEGGHAQIHPAIPAGGGTVVAVSANPELVTDPAARRRFAQRLRAVVVITVDAGQWAPAAPLGHADGDWIHLNGPGQLGRHWWLGRGTRAAALV